MLSLSAIGEFKLAQLALGPITVLLAGVQSALIALAAKRFQVDVHRAIQLLLLVGLASAGMTLLWTALLYAAPVHTMTTIFGPVWPKARVIIPFAGRASLCPGSRARPSRGCAPCERRMRTCAWPCS